VTLLTVGMSHRTAPLELRERVGMTDRKAVEVLGALIGRSGVTQAAALSTCNRTELYLEVRNAADGRRAATHALAQTGRIRPGDLDGAVRTLLDTAAARHLFRVTAGLESMVVGEAEIQGQVKRGYELALSLGTSGRVLNRLFQGALRAGKRVRAETGVSRRGASVASVAVALARRELGDLHGRRALVIGAGRHGALAAGALVDAGVQTVFVANRAQERAVDLARRFGGTAVGFDELAGELSRCDLVLTCTACPHRVLSRAELAAATSGRRLVVVDTAMPRDVEPAARDLRGVTLYDLDAIQREIERNLSARKEEAPNAVSIIEEEVTNFDRWLATLEVVPTISALRERGRGAVERVLRENEPRWQSLTDDDRRRVELVARAVVSDLLHEPTLGLRRAGERGSSALYVETVRELFGLGA
jgi:glutamyl-tRNA reductase